MRKISKGFTLLELLIVIAIIGILSGIVIVQFSDRSQERVLENSALLALDGLNRIQTMALSGQEVAGQRPVSYNFEISSCSQDCSYRLVGEIEGSFEELDLVALPKDIAVETPNSELLTVKFAPPQAEPQVFSAGLEATEPVFLKLIHLDLAAERCLEISPISGRMNLTTCP